MLLLIRFCVTIIKCYYIVFKLQSIILMYTGCYAQSIEEVMSD